MPVRTALPIEGSNTLSAEALDYALQASAPNTKRAYRAAWADFTAWCGLVRLSPLPATPETVGTFLAARAGTHKAASLSMRVVAVGQAHRLAGHRLDLAHPAIRETLKGIRRKHGTAAAKKEAEVSTIIRDAVDGRVQACVTCRPTLGKIPTKYNFNGKLYYFERKLIQFAPGIPRQAAKSRGPSVVRLPS